MDINDADHRIDQLKKSIIDLCESLHKDVSENKLDKIEKIFSMQYPKFHFCNSIYYKNVGSM